MERMAQEGNIEMSQAFYMEVWNGYERSKQLEKENKKLKDKISELEDVSKDYDLLSKDFIALGEENKNLKLIQETNENQIKNDIKERDELREENKKLNIKVASLEGEIKGLNYTIEKLKEENQTLELWLDNKEKLNEEYRKQIDLLKCQSLGPNELADSLYDADKTIKRLNGRIANLKEEVEDRGKIINKLREELSAYDREYYDEDKKAKDIYKKQYQHSLGGDDELIYEEGLYD